jgi:cytoskeletal protein CcmA (bactofilin family)
MLQTASFAHGVTGWSYLQNVQFANSAGVYVPKQPYSGSYNAAIINGSATIASGTVTSEVGATVLLGGNLVDPVGGRYQVTNTTFTGSAISLPVALTTNATFSSAATTTLASSFTLTGNVSTTSNLILNGQTVSVTGDLTTSGWNGLLTMQQPSDVLLVQGSANFFGGDTSRTLTGGTLYVAGNFTENGTSALGYAASGTHALVLNGGALQTVSFAHAIPGWSNLQHLQISNPAGVYLVNPTYYNAAIINGSVTITNGTVTSGAGATVVLAGSLFDAVGGRWQVSNTTLTGTAVSLPMGMTTTASFPSTTALMSNFAVTGPVTVTGNLNLNGHSGTIFGDFTTTSFGALTMQSPLDALSIRGNATFFGGHTNGLLTAGTLYLSGNLTQNYGHFDSFSPSGSHTVVFSGTAQQTVSFTSASSTNPWSGFQNVQFANPVRPSGRAGRDRMQQHFIHFGPHEWPLRQRH